MARQEEKHCGGYAFLENRSIDELEALLKIAVKDVPADEEYISALEAAILRREQAAPSGRLADAEQAWEQFRSAYLAEDAERFSLSGDWELHSASPNTDKPRKAAPKRIGRVLLVAAVVLILVTLLLPPVLGYRDIFQMIGQWTSRDFHFDLTSQSDPKQTSHTKDGKAADSALEMSLAEHRISTMLAPTWFPDGMRMQDSQYYQQESGNIFYRAVFRDDMSEHEIFFDLVQYPDPSFFVWEKDEGDVTEFPCGGIMHYIMTNNGQVSLHWYVDLTEAAISGDLNVDEAKAMIQSIYER